ncbi:glucose-1-phosphate cytidylyltransferase [Gluconacetobacter johannae DSM 13595]|uniref:Glucose-1-phosphate cytidylyltransferase n=1 Tax=Gluconacetobacter johannae TaxID=112140 RepID=A0A7W4P6P8_9PROT|nr:glucose-1-phosphate cytidylyltransferase [Gluconacetobacter johannae]MBB2176115.1 glucose-1-phosphate cytidylyltransferase [Gluconacetobacter johannae]GBQ85703.1 glucose-1-phosphate cytidylyltransferase [Gluconacetobacter johannae DSM 13595]
MKVVILCGGQGTRLREETEHRPKPLVEVGGRPILWHIMKIFQAYDLNSFVLCLGYKGTMIKEYFLNYRAMMNDFTMRLGSRESISFPTSPDDEDDFEVTLADTGDDSMTGARIKRVERYIPDTDDLFLVTYGDGLADVDIAKLIAFHRSHGRLATVTTVQPVSRFGVLNLEGDAVQAFVEKPRLDGWSSAGFFVFDRRVLDWLSVRPDCILEREPLERLSAAGELMAYRHDGFFFAMDTYREFLVLNELWHSGKAPWRIW